MAGIGYGIGIQYGKVLDNPLASAFEARVLADDGTFEAGACLNSIINSLQALNQIATTFNLRVLADSGTFEQINCLQTTITDLQNINIA
jgi:hypothetical protein